MKKNSKKVCMFVWNHFTNDARVLRECTALADTGFDVNLIAIHDPNCDGLKRYETRDNFNITRVKRYPLYLKALSTLVKKVKGSRKNLVAFIISIVLIGIFNWKLLFAIMLLNLLIMNKYIKTVLIRTHIFLNMIWYGLKYKSDIYHSNDLNTLPQGILCSKILRRKILIYDSHEVQSSRTGYGKGAYYIEKFLIKFIDEMIMTNETRAKYVQELYKIKKPSIVHNYPFYTGNISIEKKIDIYELLNIPRNEPVLLYQGGIQEGRGLENIVEAIEKFNRGIVVFIGDGRLKPVIKKMVKDRCLDERVRFMDKVPVDDLKYYTASAYLGFQVLNNVCFNHYSACSNKLFEYIMSNIPVIACSFPEIKRVVEEAQIGICVNSHSADEIAKGVNKLLDDKVLYNHYRENCNIAKENYNWDNEKKVFIEIYNNKISKDMYKKKEFSQTEGSSLNNRLEV